jgi:hypothetical protein
MIQTMRFETHAKAIKFIAYLVSAKVQFTCTNEDGQTLVCYPVDEEIRVGRERDQMERRRAGARETENQEPL